MDLIAKIKSALENLDSLKEPAYDLHFDEKGNVSGYVSDASINEKNNALVQEQIWKTIKERLLTDEYTKVLALIAESDEDRFARVFGEREHDALGSNIFYHQSPEKDRYWAFVDVRKTEKGFIGLCFVSNQKKWINFVEEYNYSEEVIKFMELEDFEVYPEIFNHAFSNAEAKIMGDLTKRFDQMDVSGKHGSENLFLYVFQNFQLRSIAIKKIYFTQEEIAQLDPWLEIIKKYPIISDQIIKRISISKRRHEISKELKR